MLGPLLLYSLHSVSEAVKTDNGHNILASFVIVEELDSVLRKMKNRNAAGLDEIPPRSMEDQTIR